MPANLDSDIFHIHRSPSVTLIALITLITLIRLITLQVFWTDGAQGGRQGEEKKEKKTPQVTYVCVHGHIGDATYHSSPTLVPL